MMSLILAVVSFAIQMIQARNARARAKKAQKEAAQKADEAKGLAVTTEMNPIDLPIIYGRFKAGGVRSWHEVTSSTDNATVVAGGVQIGTFNVDISGTKNEFLKFQQAICIGGFSNCYCADIDEFPADKFGGYYNIHVYPAGGVADNQGAPADFLFNDIGYLGAMFKLNRDDPQFNGVPSVTVYGDGKPVPAVVWTGAAWAVSGSPSYSNNSARVLLDYLLSPFGRNLSPDDIDLESFAKAQAICDKVMLPSMGLAGRYWLERGGTRTIRRFECNASIKTGDEIRSNVEKILESMDMAELIWSGGKYKLQLWYPVEYIAGTTYYRDDIVQTLDAGRYNLYLCLETTSSDPHLNFTSWMPACSAYVTDDYIQRGKEIAISWPNASARFNSVSVRYLNESKDFVEDTATWPDPTWALADTLLTADGGVELVGDFFEDTITDSWHAMARAEQRCRQSRIAAVYKFSVGPALSLLEPGDIIHIDSEILNIDGQLAMISSVKVQADGTLDLEAVRYDARTLAWNASDAENILLPTALDTNIKQVTDLVFDTYTPTFAGCVGTLRWAMPDDNRVTKYLIKVTNVYAHNIQSNTEWFDLGETTATWFDIPSLKSDYYTFTVVAATSNNRLAPRYDQFSGSHWPTVSAGLAAVTIDGVTYANVNVYKRSATLPATPAGGVFDFGHSALTSVPSGWSASIPSGSDAVWFSRAIAVTDNKILTDNTLEWTAPVALSINPTYVFTEPSSVVCMQDDAGNNFNFTNCKGKFYAIFNDVDISATGAVVYTLVDTINCTATLVNTPGIHQGEWHITSLAGDRGSITLNANFDGRDWPISIAIVALKQGYVADLTPPPKADTPIATAGFSYITVELATEPTYAQGHGHQRTDVYVAEHVSGSPVFADASLLTSFTGLLNTVPARVSSTYSIWYKFVSVDGISGAESNPVVVTTGMDISGVLGALDFVVLTVPTTFPPDPFVYPPGVYVRRAFIIDGEITNAKIANLAVDNAKIANASITLAKIADLAVDTAKIKDAAITSAKIKDANITTAKIADAQITNAKIADAQITTTKIADANITSAKIMDAQITTTKIADANITSAKIMNAQITTAKIADLAVDTLKIAGYAVTVPVGASGGGSSVDTASFDAGGSPVLVTAAASGYATGGSYNGTILRVYRDGSQIAAMGNTSAFGSYNAHAVVVVDYPGAGSHYYSASLQPLSGSVVPATIGVLALACKR
jgi:hypothetical protein